VLIEGNYVGTELSGTQTIGNGNGVEIHGNFNTVGGAVKRASNLISGNSSVGVLLTGNTTGNLIQGNFIGTDSTGTKPLGNLDGVFVVSGPSNNTIEENVIAASANNGISLFLGATANPVQGKKIGTYITESVGRGN